MLVQELSLTRRVRLHARIGGVLEGMYQPALEPHAAELAYHFSQSEAITGPEKVVEYSIMAGEQALQSYAYEEAEIHFRRAQASKEGQPMDAKATAILYSLARTIAATGGRLAAPVVVDNLQQAFQYYLDAGDLARAVQVAEYPVEQMAGTAVGRSEFINRPCRWFRRTRNRRAVFCPPTRSLCISLCIKRPATTKEPKTRSIVLTPLPGGRAT